MVEMRNPDPKKSRGKWWRRAVVVAALICLFWIGIIAILKWWFPNQFAIAQAHRILKSDYGLDVEIQHATIDPFARIEFRGITLYSDVGRQPLLHVESAKAGYDLASLVWRRELRINYIEIGSPNLFLSQSDSGIWNIEAVINTVIEKANLTPSSDSLTVFPIKIVLEKLDVEDIAISVQANSDSLKATGSLTGVNVRIRNLSGTSTEDLQGNASIDMPEGCIEARMSCPIEASFAAGVAAQSTVRIDSSRLFVDCDATLRPNTFTTSLEQWQPAVLPNMSLSLKAVIDQDKKTASLKPIVVSVDPIRLECQADVVFDSAVTWSFAASPMTLQLQKLFQSIKDLKLPALAELEQVPPMVGALSLDSLSITGSGTMPEMADLKAMIAGGVSVEIPAIDGIKTLPVSVNGFELSAEFSGVLLGADLVDGMARITGGIRHISADSNLASVAMDSVFWNIQMSLLDAGKSLQVKAVTGIGRLLDGTVALTADALIHLPNLAGQEPVAVEKMILQASLDHLDASLLGNGEWGGSASAEFHVAADGTGHIDGSGSMTIAQPWMLVQQERLAFPDVHQTINVNGLADVASRALDISRLDWSWEDIANVELAIYIRPQGYSVQLLRLLVDLARLKDFLPPDKLPQIDMASLAGVVACTGRVEGSLNDLTLLSYQFSPSIENVTVRISKPKASINNMTARAELSGDLNSVAGSAEMTIESGGLSDLLPQLLQSTRVTAGFHLLLPDQFGLDSFRVELPAVAFLGQGNVQLNLASIPPSGSLAFDASFGSLSGITLLDTISYTGVTRARGSLMIDTSTVKIDAELQWSDVDLSIGSLAQVKGLSGRIPITQGINLSPVALITNRPSSMAHRALGMPSYWFLQQSYHSTMPSFGTVTIDSIEIMGYGISDISMDVTAANGYLEIPSIACDAYGGNFRGDLWAEINGMSLDSVRFGLQMQAAGIQTSQLVAKSERNWEESVICGDAHLTIDGIPSSPNFDVSGKMDITRIGREVAVDLLQIMDPEGKDEGIQSTKQYLNQGWGVKVFSFAVRDGFVYSYIVPAAPPPSKLPMYVASKIVRLPPQIAYGRIPLKFLLQMQAAGG